MQLKNADMEKEQLRSKLKNLEGVVIALRDINI
jgi:hypothetical protein